MNQNPIKNAAFLNSIDSKIKSDILKNVASHYGITEEEAFDEVTHYEAEALLDYLTGNVRAAASALMQRHRIAA
jgi:hypothetical protein